MLAVRRRIMFYAGRQHSNIELAQMALMGSLDRAIRTFTFFMKLPEGLAGLHGFCFHFNSSLLVARLEYLASAERRLKQMQARPDPMRFAYLKHRL